MSLLDPRRAPDLTRRDFILSSPSSLRGVSLYGVDLSLCSSRVRMILRGRADLWCRGARAVEIKARAFTGATLTRARFCGVDLTEASFSGSLSLEGANFSDATLDLATLSETDARGATFARAHLRFTKFCGTLLEGADFSGASCLGTNYQGARAQGASFREATVNRGKFQKCDLRGADFTGATITECHFTTADIRGARFDWALLLGSVNENSWHSPFDRARVTQADYDAIALSAEEKRRFRLLIIAEDADGMADIPISDYSDEDDA